MTTAIVTNGAPRLPESATLPAVSHALFSAIVHARNGTNPSATGVAEAKKMLEATGPLFAPAKEVQLRNWLSRLNFGLSKVISAGEFEQRASAIIPALATMPAALFTVETVNEAILHFQWFPGAAEIVVFLRDRARIIANLAIGLRRVAHFGIPEAEPRREPSTEEEREAVRAQVAALVDSISADRPRPSGKPSFLSPDQLAEARRRAGINFPYPREDRT